MKAFLSEGEQNKQRRKNRKTQKESEKRTSGPVWLHLRNELRKQ